MKKRVKFTGSILAALLIMALLVLMFYDYTRRIADLETEGVKQKLSEVLEQTANTMDIKMEDSIQILGLIADKASEYDSPDNLQFISYLQGLQGKVMFSRIGAARPDGETRTSDGYSGNVSDSDYFHKAMMGDSSIENIGTSAAEQKKTFLIAVPILDGEEVKGCIYGEFESRQLEQDVNTKSFSGEGYIYIFEKDGDFVVKSAGNNQLAEGDNLFQTLGRASFSDDSSMDQMMGRIERRESGFVSYTLDGHRRLAAYEPLSISDWYIMSITPEHVVSNTAEHITTLTVLLAVKLALLFMLLLGIFIYLDRKRKGVLIATKEELEAIAANISGGVCKCSAEMPWKLEFINEGFAELYDCRGRNYSGKDGAEDIQEGRDNYYELIMQEDRDAASALIMRQLKAGEVVSAEHRVRTQDGKVKWVMARMNVITGENGHDWIYCIAMDITAWKQAEEELRISEMRYKIALEQSEHILFEYDVEGQILRMPEKAAELFGMTQLVQPVDELLNQWCFTVPEQAAELHMLFESIRAGAEVESASFQLRIADGSYVWYQVTLISIFDQNQKSVSAVGVIEDITLQKDAELSYLNEQKYREALLSDAAATFEVNFTRDWFELKGSRSYEGLEPIGTESYRELLKWLAEEKVYADDAKIFCEQFGMKNVMHAFRDGKGELELDYREPVSEGITAWFRASMHLFEDPTTNEKKGIIYLKNIDVQKRAELALQYKAMRDALSGLYNKGTTQRMIEEYLETEEAKGEMHAMIAIDIDDFKGINDSLGHIFGDAVLSEVSDSLKNIFRSTDIVGRIGGDEFLILMKNLENINIAVRKAEEVCNTFNRHYNGDGKQHCISASIGISVYPEYGRSFHELYGNADIALYQSKNKGKNQFSIYSGGNFVGYASDGRTEEEPEGMPQKSFRDNILEYVFRILYDSKDKKIAITSVLELVTRHFEMSRGYIFEVSEQGACYINTYEWCNDGMESQMKQFEKVAFSDVPDYLEHFRANGHYILTNLEEADGGERLILETQGVKVLVQSAIRDGEKIVGFVGFDQCVNEAMPSVEAIDVFRMVSNILGEFLMRTRAESFAEINRQLLMRTLDNLDNFIYIVEPHTYELLFVNAKTSEATFSARLGETCYKAFFDRETPCETCPMRNLEETGEFSRMELYNLGLGVWTKAKAGWTTWTDGKQVCLIDCADISEYQEKKLHQSKQID